MPIAVSTCSDIHTISDVLLVQSPNCRYKYSSKQEIMRHRAKVLFSEQRIDEYESFRERRLGPRICMCTWLLHVRSSKERLFNIYMQISYLRSGKRRAGACGACRSDYFRYVLLANGALMCHINLPDLSI